MAFVVFIAIYLLSIAIIHGLNIYMKHLVSMWLIFTPLINTVFALYILAVVVLNIAITIINIIRHVLNIMLNILCVEITNYINKIYQ